ncbi:fumarate reductase/succinate dehydrogenase flavoprotein, partial [Arthrobacter sp. Hiyo6]
DLARSLPVLGLPRNQPLNTPAHVIVDHNYLERYGILAHRAGQPTPAYLVEAPTLAELAAKLNVPAESLEATVRGSTSSLSRARIPTSAGARAPTTSTGATTTTRTPTRPSARC